MPRSYSATVLVAMLVLGLVIGATGALFYGAQTARASITTTTEVQAITIVSTMTQTPTLSNASSSKTSGNVLTLAMLQTALKNSENATLGLQSYEFGKGSLDAWVTNNGTLPIVLAPQLVIYNGTYQSDTFFTILDPHVIQYGTYAYLPPGSEIIIQVVPNPPPLTPSSATLQVFNNTFAFKYGTSKD
jgi:hypothetical protein